MLDRVVATGTFDLLHPGHVLYLERSRALGDELVVIVARDVNVRHKPKPVLPEEQRQDGSVSESRWTGPYWVRRGISSELLSSSNRI